MPRSTDTVNVVPDWEMLSDEELLKVRVRDLGLRVEGTHLQDKIQRLYAELGQRGIALRPPCYLADEWLTPDKIPTIGIPFFLAHPRLTALEQKIMLEVEGGTDAWCMKLLRHETGHAINYAYRLYLRTRWRELFGPFSTPYSSRYWPRPYSRRFVTHLEDNYAQAHPDEDFAETFAVWLTPGSDWATKYEGWPALKKLRYVDRVMKTIGGEKPKVTVHRTPWSAARMVSTLEAFYQRKRQELGVEYSGYYDPALRRIFSARPADSGSPSASRFLRKRRRMIVDSAALWTGERKYDIDKLLRKLTARCEHMGLHVHRPDEETLGQITAFVVAVTGKAGTLRRKALER
jgi:hypothetical protein